MPEQRQLSGYHIESLAIEAIKYYNGSMTVKAIVKRILDNASSRVLTPIKDITGQSRTVDSYLGRANSTERRMAADVLATIVRKMDAATTVNQWKAIMGFE